MQTAQIYCDGACSGNPGAGGWGAVVLYEDGSVNELSGGEKDTTNNRMELMAAIEGLSYLSSPTKVSLYSDSSYLVNCFKQGWMTKWKSNGWKNSKGEAVANRELWEALDTLLQNHEADWNWVKGHNGNQYNEMADRLAVRARESLV